MYCLYNLLYQPYSNGMHNYTPMVVAEEVNGGTWKLPLYQVATPGVSQYQKRSRNKTADA